MLCCLIVPPGAQIWNKSWGKCVLRKSFSYKLFSVFYQLIAASHCSARMYQVKDRQVSNPKVFWTFLKLFDCVFQVIQDTLSIKHIHEHIILRYMEIHGFKYLKTIKIQNLFGWKLSFYCVLALSFYYPGDILPFAYNPLLYATLISFWLCGKANRNMK